MATKLEYLRLIFAGCIFGFTLPAGAAPDISYVVTGLTANTKVTVPTGTAPGTTNAIYIYIGDSAQNDTIQGVNLNLQTGPLGGAYGGWDTITGAGKPTGPTAPMIAGVIQFNVQGGIFFNKTAGDTGSPVVKSNTAAKTAGNTTESQVWGGVVTFSTGTYTVVKGAAPVLLGIAYLDTTTTVGGLYGTGLTGSSWQLTSIGTLNGPVSNIAPSGTVVTEAGGAAQLSVGSAAPEPSTIGLFALVIPSLLGRRRYCCLK